MGVPSQARLSTAVLIPASERAPLLSCADNFKRQDDGLGDRGKIKTDSFIGPKLCQCLRNATTPRPVLGRRWACMQLGKGQFSNLGGAADAQTKGIWRCPRFPFGANTPVPPPVACNIDQIEKKKKLTTAVMPLLLLTTS